MKKTRSRFDWSKRRRMRTPVHQRVIVSFLILRLVIRESLQNFQRMNLSFKKLISLQGQEQGGVFKINGRVEENFLNFAKMSRKQWLRD